MTKNKILEVIERYRQKFIEIGVDPIDFDHNSLAENTELTLGHCHGMLDQMVEFLKEERVEKTFRWLGFIQGCLFTEKIYTLNELMNHNRP